MTNVSVLANGFQVLGDLPVVGKPSPDFVLTDKNLQATSLSDFVFKRKLLNIFPSLDTGVCARSAKKFNEELQKINDTVLINISADLPFAQKNFCASNQLSSLVTLSTFRSPTFMRDFGVEIGSGPMRGLCARAVIVLDQWNNVVHVELVHDIGHEPNYDAALRALAAHPVNKSTIAVSGASGFIGLHIVSQALAQGHSVVALVRDANNVEKTADLRAFGGAVKIVSASLGNKEQYVEALKGCNTLIHVASPYFYVAEDPQRDIVDPAVNGTLVAIEAAVANKLSRVVVTSSGGAFLRFPIDSGYQFTAADWNRWSSLTNNPYFLSKRVAEEAAWEKAKTVSVEIVVVNPVFVIGPLLTASSLSTSLKRVVGWLESKPLEVGGSIGAVDVRDVALAHLLAALHPRAAGQRLFCCGGVVAWNDLKNSIGASHPQFKSRLPADHPLPLPQFSIDTSPLAALGMPAFRTPIDAVRASVDSLVQFNLVK